jgi:hypothetical protein
MSHLEPSYLRYIYDGLEKGDLHPDNAASLPEGLIGLYEEAFEENKSPRERQKLLETFATWALLKKEVSAQFVAEILDVPTQKIIDFIATYSSWFTSPESGKYQLYHERLKVYLLQKLSEKEITILHNKLISRLELAIGEQKEDEFEYYGMAFIGLHHFIESNDDLYEFINDTNIWERQLFLFNSYKWVKFNLQIGIELSTKTNNEILIDCSLNLLLVTYNEINSILEITDSLDIDILEIISKIESYPGILLREIESKTLLYFKSIIVLSENKTSNTNYNLQLIIDSFCSIMPNSSEDFEIYECEFSEFYGNITKLIFQIFFEYNIDFNELKKRLDPNNEIEINHQFNIKNNKDLIFDNFKFEIYYEKLKNDILYGNRRGGRIDIDSIADDIRETIINIIKEYNFKDVSIYINQLIDLITFENDKSDCYREILDLLIYKGDLKNSILIINAFLKSKPLFKREYERDKTISHLAIELTNYKKPSVALKLLDNINNEFYFHFRLEAIEAIFFILSIKSPEKVDTYLDKVAEFYYTEYFYSLSGVIKASFQKNNLPESLRYFNLLLKENKSIQSYDSWGDDKKNTLIKAHEEFIYVFLTEHRENEIFFNEILKYQNEFSDLIAKFERDIINNDFYDSARLYDLIIENNLPLVISKENKNYFFKNNEDLVSKLLSQKAENTLLSKLSHYSNKVNAININFEVFKIFVFVSRHKILDSEFAIIQYLLHLSFIQKSIQLNKYSDFINLDKLLNLNEINLAQLYRYSDIQKLNIINKSKHVPLNIFRAKLLIDSMQDELIKIESTTLLISNNIDLSINDFLLISLKKLLSDSKYEDDSKLIILEAYKIIYLFFKNQNNIVTSLKNLFEKALELSDDIIDMDTGEFLGFNEKTSITIFNISKCISYLGKYKETENALLITFQNMLLVDEEENKLELCSKIIDFWLIELDSNSIINNILNNKGLIIPMNIKNIILNKIN